MKHNFYLFFSLTLGILFHSTITSAQFVNFEDTWREFLDNNKISNTSELTRPSKENKIDYAKYALMYANSNFCQSRQSEAASFMKEIRNIGEETYKTIPRYKEKFDDLDEKMKAYHKVDNLWKRFLRTKNIGLDELEAVAEAKTVCEKGTLAKYFYMVAHHHYCNGDILKAKENFAGRVQKLAEKTSLKVSSIEGLEEEVAKMKTTFEILPKLGTAWKKYTQSGISPGFDSPLPVFVCYPIPNMKEYVLRGAADVCGVGAAMVKKIRKLQVDSGVTPDGVLAEKIDRLESQVSENESNVAAVNKAWSAFLQTNEVKGEKNYGYEYCGKEPLIRAYVLDGFRNVCEEGKAALEKISDVRKAHNPELAANTIERINKLATTVDKYDFEAETLNKLWTEFASNDTLTNEFNLADFYCDKILQVKSWTIKGHFNTCENGQKYLDKIEDYKRTYELEFEEDLACQVLRLRIKIWDCRYWELVLQARAETHAERERFGPESAKIMHGDLNSDQQPCETTVEYTPLGHIGVKYVITAYLCQDIDLAKMGDPEYYKKISLWVDTEVLQKYCEESMRCKEEFFIYLEGHTDGNAFRGARYKNSLDIPEGTEFTHFTTEGEEIATTTEREITNSLKSNMELGIARAWTVKNQLDFMQVPIKIGAYEHPDDEKGGEFRRIEIELNITKLLLDFYEKRLAELVEESGIGERPTAC